MRGLAGSDVEGDGMVLQRRLFAAGLHVKFTGQTGILAPLVADGAGSRK